MGACASSEEKLAKKKEIFLIGDISKKRSGEKKIYSLAKVCLQTTTHSPSDVVMREENESTGKDMLRRREKCSTLLYVVILPSDKSIYSTETYISWRARNDLERATTLYMKKPDISLVQINSFPSFISDFKIDIQGKELDFYGMMQKFLSIFFMGKNVKWVDKVDTEHRGWNISSRIHSKTGKLQLLVKDFYQPLQKLKPRSSYCILGFSWCDLYPSEKLNFVLGEASSANKSGVVSFGRCEPKKYDADTYQDITQFNAELLWKVLKCSSHEMCHLFGMSHCEFFRCSMNGSDSVSQAMSQPLFLCPVCLRKLQHACQFDIQHRYHEMLLLLQDVQMVMPCENWADSIDWLQAWFRQISEDISDLSCVS